MVASPVLCVKLPEKSSVEKKHCKFTVLRPVITVEKVGDDYSVATSFKLSLQPLKTDKR